MLDSQLKDLILGDASDREAAIVARCSKYAAQYIQQMRGHPLYLEVLTRLEAIEGSLFELDVEHAFYESLRAEQRKASQKSADADAPKSPDTMKHPK